MATANKHHHRPVATETQLDKGLKTNALGLLSSIVIGVARRPHPRTASLPPWGS